jgi:hypothetical protein
MIPDEGELWAEVFVYSDSISDAVLKHLPEHVGTTSRGCPVGVAMRS